VSVSSVFVIARYMGSKLGADAGSTLVVGRVGLSSGVRCPCPRMGLSTVLRGPRRWHASTNSSPVRQPLAPLV